MSRFKRERERQEQGWLKAAAPEGYRAHVRAMDKHNKPIQQHCEPCTYQGRSVMATSAVGMDVTPVCDYHSAHSWAYDATSTREQEIQEMNDYLDILDNALLTVVKELGPIVYKMESFFGTRPPVLVAFSAAWEALYDTPFPDWIVANRMGMPDQVHPDIKLRRWRPEEMEAMEHPNREDMRRLTQIGQEIENAKARHPAGKGKVDVEQLNRMTDSLMTLIPNIPRRSSFIASINDTHMPNLERT